MKKILITTTESLFGWEIETYIKPVFASVVIGANAFADISASLTDIFGGRSNTYEKRLQLLKDNALSILTVKALELGANCILGLRVDVDEISGKGTQMFMITACGTAVIAINAKTYSDTKHLDRVDKDLIKDKADIIRLQKKFQSHDVPITLEELKTVVESKDGNFKNFIIAKLRGVGSSKLQEEYIVKFTDLYKQYFSEIEQTDAVPVLYEALLNDTDEKFLKTIVSIISDNDLLDFDYVYKLLDGNLQKRKIALSISLVDKPGYSIDDIARFEKLIGQLKTSFEKVATISTKKGFLSSTEKEVWNCICGNSNSMDSSTCSYCFKDQYGFTQDELKPERVIKILCDKIDALKQVLI